MSARHLLVLALVLWLAGLPACADALYTRSRSRAGQAVVLDGRELLAPGTTKADLLADLGAPRQVLALPEGDLFVYELELLDLDTFALKDPSGAASPVFQYSAGLLQEHSLFCWFDGQGRLVEASRAVARSSR